MTVSPPTELPTPASSSRILNVTWKVHHKANSSSTTDLNLSELNHDNRSEKGYSNDSGFLSKIVRKARHLGRSIFKSKNIPHALPSESSADVPAPVVTVDAPESTGATIARESDTVQLLQSEDCNSPPQPLISNLTDSQDTNHPSPLVASSLRYDIFLADAPKPTVRATVPTDSQTGIVSTLQLVLCARLLLEDHHPLTSPSRSTGVGVLDDAVRHWLSAIQEDLSAQARIRRLVSRLVKEFRNDLSPEPEAISEVVILGPVLCEVDYRDLLSCFIERFDHSALLNPSLLQGMIQLLQSAPSGFLTDDDLARILSSLRKRLESTHAPDRIHVYQLVFAVSKVLEVMVRGEVKGLNRQRDHQSLLAALRNLKDVDDDEFLKFQVSYAYQMSLYLPDDETLFQAFWRYAESVAVGVSAVASVFKLDPMSAFTAVKHIQQIASNAIDVVMLNMDGSQAAENAYWSQKKQPWFLALQAGYLFVRDGRLVDFNRLVCDATCRDDVNFQRGVCQILGEIALNPLWDDGSRRSAIDFLGELCKTEAGRRKDVKVKTWIATTLQQISSLASPDISDYATTLLDHLQQEHALDIKVCRALRTPLPIPTVFPLLERALYVTDIDHELACIQFHSHDKRLYPAFIPLRAKATLLAPRDQAFPLMAKVQEFLQSDKLVFLLLGDSGSGKSMFCRKLEVELWNQHQHSDGGRIPLYIYLPSIDDPHSDLIGKYLRLHHNISEKTIQNIKNHRQFVLICDGYDESRLIQNLYTTNRLNRPGQWNVKMILTCRSTFLGPDYQIRFYPLEDSNYHDNSSRLFEEATIVPFQKSDIQEFVKQYVLDVAAQEPSDNPSAPSFDDYWEKLSVIPNVMNLASNPFLLTLALRAIPSRSIEALDSKGLKAMQHDLYDGFMQEWIRLQKIRLQGTILKQDIRAAAFDNLLRDRFSWCVTDYLKRLADAIYQYQDGRPVVKFSRRHMEEWKVEFFGPEIETTLLREASPLARAGIRHWFIHKSLLDYFYALSFYDPVDSDDDDSDDSEDGDDDSRGGGGDFHSGGGNALGNGGDGLTDNNGNSTGGNEGSTGGSAQSTNNNGGSSGGNGGSSGGNGGSTSGNQDSSGGIGNSFGGSSGSPSGGNNSGSRGGKNGSDGDEDGSRRRKGDASSKRKGKVTKSRPSKSSDPFSKRNLFKEPSVLQFLVERAESDPRLKKRLFSAIEQSKASSVPSMAAANAITILFKSKHLFEDAILDGVLIPRDYMSMAMGSTEPVQLPESNLTGRDLIKVLVTLTTPESESTVPATASTVPVSAPTVPVSIPFSAKIAQKTSTASWKPYRFVGKNRPPLMPPMPKPPPYSTLDLKVNSVLSQAITLPSENNQSTTSPTAQEKARVLKMIPAEDVPNPVSETVRSVLQDLTVDQSAMIEDPYQLRAHLPLFSTSSPFAKVQNIIEGQHVHPQLEQTASLRHVSSRTGDVPTIAQGLATVQIGPLNLSNLLGHRTGRNVPTGDDHDPDDASDARSVSSGRLSPFELKKRALRNFMGDSKVKETVPAFAASLAPFALVGTKGRIQSTAPDRNAVPASLKLDSRLLKKTPEFSIREYGLYNLKLMRIAKYKQAVYIDPMAKHSLQDTDDNLFPLMDKVRDFLAGDSQVMLILGDSAVGKSTFNRHLEHELWQEYKPGGNIPLFVNLPALELPERDLVAEQLRTHNFMEDQIRELKLHRQFTLICDGYDESQLTSNLHITNLFNRSGQWDVKMLITCRTQYLGPNYRSRFEPKAVGQYNRVANDLFQQAVIAPFSREQVEDYVERYIPPEPRPWIKKDYMDTLEAIPNLMDLVRNPFLLTLSLEALPTVLQGRTDLSRLRVTRAELYDTFIRHWTAVNKRRLEVQRLDEEKQMAFQKLLKTGFEQSVVKFQQDLAVAIFVHQDGKPVVDYMHRRDKSSWKATFFSTDCETSVLRDASLLSRAGSQYRFVHRSILEYFFACTICGPNDDQDELDPLVFSDTSANMSTISAHPLSQRNLITEPSIILFLAERVQLDSGFKDKLFAIIELSKTDNQATQAAANAITILVKAGVRFNGADLRGIRVPGADISGGQFDSAQLQEADLTGVNLTKSWIRQADFTRAQMEGVQFGEMPSLNESQGVYSCTYSPDGTSLAVGLFGGHINIYDTSMWTMTCTFQGHRKRVKSIAYSPSSLQLLSGSNDNTVRLWDCESRSCVFVLDGHTDEVWTVAFSPSGKQVASAGRDKTVRLWDIQTGANLSILTGHTERISSISFSPDGHAVVSVGGDGMIRFFDTQTGQPGEVWESQSGKMMVVAYSPGGLEIAVGNDNGELLLYSTTTGKPTRSWKAHGEKVECLSFSPDSQYVATCGYDRTVKVWSTVTGSVLSVFASHGSSVLQVAFSPNGLQLASCSLDWTIRLWDVSSLGTGVDVKDESDPLTSALFSPNGQVLFSGTSSGAVWLYDAVSGESGLAIACKDNLGSCLAISPDGLRIALVGTSRIMYGKVITVWDIETGQADVVLRGHTKKVSALVFSADSRWIATGSNDKTVRLWDARSGKLDRVLDGHTDFVRDLAFSPDSCRILSGSLDGTIRAWDLDSRECRVVVEMSGGYTPEWTISSSSNGWRVASKSYRSRCVDCWDAESGQLQQTLEHDGIVFCLAFSSCGQWVGVGLARSVWLWNFVADTSVEGGGGGGVWKCSVRIRGIFGQVNSIAWKPDTLEFGTGCGNGSLQVWRLVETSSPSNTWSAQLVWSAGNPILAASDAVFSDAVGLSPANQQLLTQYGKGTANRFFYM